MNIMQHNIETVVVYNIAHGLIENNINPGIQIGNMGSVLGVLESPAIRIFIGLILMFTAVMLYIDSNNNMPVSTFLFLSGLLISLSGVVPFFYEWRRVKRKKGIFTLDA